MKHLMILGPACEREAFVKAARTEHYEVVVGSETHEPADLIGGAYHLFIQGSDPDAVLDAAARLGVSGILGYGTGEALAASYAAHYLGLPGIPYAETRLLHNLIQFRIFQRQHHFHFPAFCDITDEIHLQGIQFPLYVGPEDDDFLQNTVLVQSVAELRRVRTQIIRSSPGSRVLVQEDLSHSCMNPHDTLVFVITDLIIRDGILQPPVWSECMMCTGSNDPAPTGFWYPARIEENSRILLASECTHLVELLQLQNAELGIMAVIVPGRIPYILNLRPCSRNGRMIELLSLLYHHDLFRDMVRIVAGDRPSVSDLYYPQEERYMAVYAVRVHRSGILRYIRFHGELNIYIRDWKEYVRQSEPVYANARHGQYLGSLFMQFPDQQTMEQTIERMDTLIEVVIDNFEGGW